MTKYTKYQLEKALKYKEKVKILNSVQCEVGDYTVTYLPRKDDYTCSCKWASDGKCKKKYCSHILAIMSIMDNKRFWKEVSKE